MYNYCVGTTKKNFLIKHVKKSQRLDTSNLSICDHYSANVTGCSWEFATVYIFFDFYCFSTYHAVSCTAEGQCPNDSWQHQ